MQLGTRALREVDLAASLRAFRGLPVGVAVWQLPDTKDVRSLRLVATNPALERELGAPIDFAVGKPITEGFPKLLDTPVPDLCRRVILSGKPGTLGELAYRDARIPGGVFCVGCFPLPENCAGVTFENITESKRLIQAQRRALLLLHRITLFLNDATTVLEAAQFCVDEICTQIGWPVGRFFLSHETSPSRFVPNPVWHLPDSRRFLAFRKATELYESDLTNKLALEYRSVQGRKAGLVKSVGFSVVENDFLRGVLEFSSEALAPLDEHTFRAISNVGFQLGQVFARGRLAREREALRPQVLVRDVHRSTASHVPFSSSRTVKATSAALEANERAQRAIRVSSGELVESTRHMQKHLDELKRLIATD